MKLFDAVDYNALCALFEPDVHYAGYKPEQMEAPNGDGNVDAKKRYLHIALKYDPPEYARWFLARAHFEACRIAEAIGVPAEFYPKVENGTLRVLDYPAGAGSAEHTDFDLFTVHCYRSTPRDFVRLVEEHESNLVHAESIDPDVHFGDIGEAVGLGKATRHLVPERDYPQQAIVYFAMPANNARMPDSACIAAGLPIGTGALEWIGDRYKRSRVYK